MKIRVKQSTIVKPAKETPRHSLWLSNIDLIQVRLHMGTLHFYKPLLSSNVVGTRFLKDALSDILVPYYPAAGRLRRGENGRLEVHCNGEGVLFVEAETDSTVSDIGLHTPSLDLARLAPSVDYSGGISSYPLLLFQVTFFKCGAICMGAQIHHTFGDGASLVQLMEAWAQTARGLRVKELPFLDRNVLRARDPPSPMFPHTEYQPPPFQIPTLKSSIYRSAPETESMIATLRLTPLQLNALRTKVDGSDGQYSLYEILVAHIWRCACFSELKEKEHVTRLHIILDGRTRLEPKLPKGYVGNVLFHARPAVLSSDLRGERFGKTAERIRGEIRKMRNDYLRSAIDYLENHPNLEELVPGEGNPIFGGSNLCVVGLSRHVKYGLDFGWGRKLYTRASHMNEGKGFVMEGEEEDGSLVVMMCLKKRHMVKFEKLFYESLPVAAL
ncbi:PREDICTED: shikimate O-hydroxycinnamoyltransferase [Tarenaya hassleriana]|uniref:shikimate O-hydroxycinnamoyltransferase n=1 Tax=Tarenaya hassleriana TaxID=28532 RepID=UPI00053C7E62|nr:PREDICTED: shikimate O-hydroxycinnamoyltransferase [Tarenaya hassleriana]XP_019058573.1 PREDICTED: shikimate O-hydroxycinnamoyltransferase [Tarenaya hassleriana]